MDVAAKPVVWDYCRAVFTRFDSSRNMNSFSCYSFHSLYIQMSRRDEGSETPTRVAMYESRTPQRTPQRHTPTRTPTGRSFFNPGTMQRPTPPDFTALAKEQQQQRQSVLGKRNDNNFVAYNPEKEPIKVPWFIWLLVQSLTHPCIGLFKDPATTIHVS